MEEKEDGSYSVYPPGNFQAIDYSSDHHQHHLHGHHLGENSASMADYLLNTPPPVAASLDKLSFADVMQFADFGPKLALNQPKASDEYNGMDPVHFLKFPVLGDKSPASGEQMMGPLPPVEDERFGEMMTGDDKDPEERAEEEEGRESTSMRLRLLGSVHGGGSEGRNRRKRPRAVKTSEEVESQRMTHIAVERNRRKQMNEHLRVLRSIMPGSYVQRGDQASIIGGAIEFVRELEQLLQCLESQKRRRLYGGEAGQREAAPPAALPPPPLSMPPAPQMPFFPSLPAEEEMKLLELEGGLREESAEIKSCLADIEVKLLGFDALIKILSRRRPGQLLKTIAALEDLQFTILHTNITTIEETVLYSFNVKVGGDSRFSAEGIASSVQQVLNFINASSV